MLPLVIFGLCVAVGLYLVAGWFVAADPKTLARMAKGGGLVLAAVVIVLLAVTGRLGAALAAGAVLLPVVLRWRAIAGRFRDGRRPSAGQVSSLRTAYLDLTLDHDTGAIAGTVRRGRFAGRALGDLTLDDLRALHAECAAADPQSEPVIAAFLDRTFGADWREAGGAGETPPGRGGRGMSREEALSVLGLAADASEDDIREAHRRLMKRLHPDQGGSDYLAAKLNEAKDVLLG